MAMSIRGRLGRVAAAMAVMFLLGAGSCLFDYDGDGLDDPGIDVCVMAIITNSPRLLFDNWLPAIGFVRPDCIVVVYTAALPLPDPPPKPV